MSDLLREIGKIYRALESMGNVEFKQFELAKGQYAYLVRICENPGIILERLSEMLKIDRATASRAVAKLELSGLIQKESDLENKKILRLIATPKGMELYEVLRAEEEYSHNTALSGITEEEQRVLLELLERIQNNLEPEWTKVKRGGQRKYLKKFTRKE